LIERAQIRWTYASSPLYMRQLFIAAYCQLLGLMS